MNLVDVKRVVALTVDRLPSTLRITGRMLTEDEEEVLVDSSSKVLRSSKQQLGKRLRGRTSKILRLVALDAPHSSFEQSIVSTLPHDRSCTTVLLSSRKLSPHLCHVLSGQGIMTILHQDGGNTGDQRLAEKIATLYWRSVAQTNWRIVCQRVPLKLRPLCRTALLLSSRPLRVKDLARQCGYSERGLRNLCSTISAPTPQWLVGWGRLGIAAYCLDELALTAVETSSLLHFRSACALRNQLRRYTHSAIRGQRGTRLIDQLAVAVTQSESTAMRRPCLTDSPRAVNAD